MLATRQTRSIGELVDAAFRVIGVPEWRGLVDTLGRLVETAEQRGDTRTHMVLKRRATVDVEELVHRMVVADLAPGNEIDAE